MAQSGFRHIFACETALSNILNKWTEAIDKGLLNGVIFLDLPKAFDRIDHNILLRKLQMYMCSDATMKWFTYIYERNQHTSFKGKLSDKLSIKTFIYLFIYEHHQSWYITLVNDKDFHL